MTQLIHDWNRDRNRSAGAAASPALELVDETLRDGCQSASVRTPSLEEQIRILGFMDRLGVAVADVGLPGAGRQQPIAALIREIQAARLRLRPMVACRTLIEPDLRAAADLAQATGAPLTVYAFIGSSPIRQWAEDWPLASLLERTVTAVKFLVREGLPVVYVTEDTTRTPPRTLRALFSAAVQEGAGGLCLCDTVGHVTERGLSRLYRWSRRLLRQVGRPEVTLDWHGHNDRGLALAVALRAVELGFDRVHGCALGIGERAGNTALDLLILNLTLAHPGRWDHPVSELVAYVRFVSAATGVDIPPHHPLSGRDAFRTATGVHAAAIRKALGKNDPDLADRVYSVVSPRPYGRRHEIEIGNLSGLSNVHLWLEQRGLPRHPELAAHLLAQAKDSDRVLSEAELIAAVQRWQAAPGT